MQVKNFEDLKMYGNKPGELTQESLSFNENRNIFQGFWSAGSDPTGSDLSHVKYRRRI